MFDTSSAGLPSWRKYVCMADAIENMRIREKRQVFQVMRSEQVSKDTFLPRLGISVSEFAVFQVLSDNSKRTSRA